jgi:excisionase family DNA binding protein
MQMDSHKIAPLAYGTAQAGQRLGIGKTHLFSIIRTGELKTFTIGNRRMIPEAEIQAFIARRMAAAQPGA